MLGHIRSQHTAKLQIFTCWSLFALTVGAVRGRTSCVHAFGHWMAHLSAIFGMAGSSDTTRFGSLEFPALPPIGMWVPPIFESSQTFLFESLNFIVDQLGVLRLREKALFPTPVGGASSVGSGTLGNLNDEAPTLCSKPTLAQTPL